MFKDNFFNKDFVIVHNSTGLIPCGRSNHRFNAVSSFGLIVHVGFSGLDDLT